MAGYRYKESGAPIAKIYEYACEQCGNHWDVLAEPNEPPPDNCPKCLELEVSGPIPSTHSIGGSPLNRSVSKMYSDLEKTSAWRAEQAGAPDLKITNLKDNHFGGNRPGDVLAQPVVNDVTRYAESAGMSYFGSAPGGVAVSDLVTASRSRGMAPGAKGLAAIQSKTMGGGPIPPRRR